MKKIYTKVKRNRKDNLHAYLEKLFSSRTYKLAFPSSYRDKKCTREECAWGKARSIEALFNVASTTFPNLTFKTFARTLIDVIQIHNAKEDKSTLKLGLLYCPDINKWTLHGGVYHTGKYFFSTVRNYMDSIEKIDRTKGKKMFTMRNFLLQRYTKEEIEKEEVLAKAEMAKKKGIPQGPSLANRSRRAGRSTGLAQAFPIQELQARYYNNALASLERTSVVVGEPGVVEEE